MRTKSKLVLRIFIAIVVLAALAYGLGWSKLISVKSISMSGTELTSVVEAQLDSGESKLVVGTPLARINLRTEENLITNLEWVASAKISRNWLSGALDVQITERIPVAVFSISATETQTSSPRYLASDGVEFSSPKRFEDLARISLGNKSLNQRRQVATFVANLSSDLVQNLTGLQITKSGAILMNSNLRESGLTVNWGAGNSPTDVKVKSRVLVGLLGLPENKKISQIDLTSAQFPIVK